MTEKCSSLLLWQPGMNSCDRWRWRRGSWRLLPWIPVTAKQSCFKRINNAQELLDIYGPYIWTVYIVCV